MIFLEPVGGLANRLRVIASGIWLKNKTDMPLVVIWNTNSELNCPYELLFESAVNFTVISKSPFVKPLVQVNKMKGFAKVIGQIKNKISGVDIYITDDDGVVDIYETIKRKKRIYIKTCFHFSGSIEEFSQFKPTPMLKKCVDTIIDSLGDNPIGVQIRRTDNAKSIVNSPTSLFIIRMTEILVSNPDTKFFLATDDLSVKEEITAKFGDKVAWHNAEISRTTNAGIQSAVVDMYTLSRTKLVLGSYWSSFSEVAAMVGQTKLEVIKTND